MATTLTNLTAACGLNDQSITVASATGFAVRNVISVDGEYMIQTGAAIGTVIPVQRGGQYGTAQTAHPSLAPVKTMLPADVPLARPGQIIMPHQSTPVLVSYGADGAIVPPTTPTTILVTKATAAALTIVSPTAATPDGVEVTITSTTAAAHTVTYTDGFNGTTSSSDVATFAATKGNSITLISAKGVWGVKALAGVTIA